MFPNFIFMYNVWFIIEKGHRFLSDKLSCIIIRTKSLHEGTRNSILFHKRHLKSLERAALNKGGLARKPPEGLLVGK